MSERLWLEDCRRVVDEFNDVALAAFRQEFGNGEASAVIEMALCAEQEDLQLTVGARASFLVEGATGLVFKIGSDGRVRYEKCLGHISGVSGRELYRWLWW
jgi:hypothetical protein